MADEDKRSAAAPTESAAEPDKASEKDPKRSSVPPQAPPSENGSEQGKAEKRKSLASKVADGAEGVAKLLRKGSDVSRQPSKNPPMSPAQPTSAGGDGFRSRKGSMSTQLIPQGSVLQRKDSGVAATAAPAAEPGEAIALAPQGSNHGSQAGTPTLLGRQQSRQSLSESRRDAAPLRQGSTAQLSRQGSQVVSRRGSVARQSAQGSQVAEPLQLLGSEDLAASVHEEAAAEAAPAEAAAAVASDEFDGVDFRMNWQLARKDLEACQEKLRSKEAELQDLKSHNSSLERQVRELNQSLADAHAGADDGDQLVALQKQLQKKDEKMRELERQVRRRGSQVDQISQQLQREVSKPTVADGAKDGQISDLKSQLRDSQQEANALRSQLANPSLIPEVRSKFEELQSEMQLRDQDLKQKSVQVQQLQVKLAQAQEAIVSATDYGWENDIKLAQARRALVSILEHHSPERARPGSKRREIRSPPADTGPTEEMRRLNDLKSQMQNLVSSKAAAVEAEDFGLAAQLKSDLQATQQEIAALEGVVALQSPQ